MSFDTGFDDAFDAPSQAETTALSAGQSDATRLLIRARGFIERGWCKKAQACDIKENRVSPNSSHAVCWCAEGALMAAGVQRGLFDHPAYQRLRDAMGERVAVFNDQQETVEPVLAAFDRAIAATGSGP